MQRGCLALALAVWLAASGCPQPEPQLSQAYDRSFISELSFPQATWTSRCDLPVRERIGLPSTSAPVTLQRPVSPDFVEDLIYVLEHLPLPFARLLQRHVCALLLVHDAPMTATVRAHDLERTRSILVLNVDKLNMLPNDWLVFKETTPFEPAPNRYLRGKLAEPDDNTRRVLMEFVIVHELGHVADLSFPDHILIDDFKSISWPRQDALAKTPLIHYPERLNAPPLPDQRLEAYYDIIANGAFASPATVSNDKEDFAESLATFTHTVIRGRPWELEVHRDARLVRRLSSCWSEARCRRKRVIIEELLERWGRR